MPKQKGKKTTTGKKTKPESKQLKAARKRLTLIELREKKKNIQKQIKQLSRKTPKTKTKTN